MYIYLIKHSNYSVSAPLGASHMSPGYFNDAQPLHGGVLQQRHQNIKRLTS